MNIRHCSLIPIRSDSAAATPAFVDEMAAPHDREVYRCGRWAAGKVIATVECTAVRSRLQVMLPSRVCTGVLVEAFRSESFMAIVESLLKHTSR